MSSATSPSSTEVFEAEGPDGVDTADDDVSGAPAGAPESTLPPPELPQVLPDEPDPLPPPPLPPPPPPPLPTPAEVNRTCETRFDCGLQTRPVEDNSVVVSFFAGLVLGAVSLTAFSCLWKVVKVYTSRQRLKQVAFKPPDVPVSQCWGLQRYWGWIYPVLTIRTEDIYLAAGLDAVVMLKTIEYGVQLFVPLAVVCLAVLVPVHLKGDNLTRRDGTTTGSAQEAFPFVRLTIANLSEDRTDTSIYWLHFTVAHVFVLYSLWLIRQHYEDMLAFRLKNLMVGDDHHQSALKQAAMSATEDQLKQITPTGTSPPAGSHDRLASNHPSQALQSENEGLLNESWVAYQQHPGFVRESLAADARSAVLHAPLEPSPNGAHDTIQSSNAGRSADLGSLQAAEPAATPSVWSGARRRVMQVVTPARNKWSPGVEGMGLAFTDMLPKGFQGPAALSRPLPTISPSVAGSQSAAGGQRSATGTIFDVASMKSQPTRRSLSISGRPPGVDTSASSPSLSPPNQPPRTSHSMGGGNQQPASSVRSLPTAQGRAGHSTSYLSSASSAPRTVDRYSDQPHTRGGVAGEPYPAVGSVSSSDGGAITYIRTRSGSRRAGASPAMRSGSLNGRTPSLSQGDMASPGQHSAARSRTGSSPSQPHVTPKRRGHATQPSFSEYVGATSFNPTDPFQQPPGQMGNVDITNMPSFDRLSPADSRAQSRQPMSAGRYGSNRSEPDTPTLGAGGSQLPSTIVHEDVMSPQSSVPSSTGPQVPGAGSRGDRRGGPAVESMHRTTSPCPTSMLPQDRDGASCSEPRSRRAGPAAESTRPDRGHDNPRSSDEYTRSPFEQESSIPLGHQHSAAGGDTDHHTDAGLATFPLAAAGGDTSIAGGASIAGMSAGRSHYYLPPETHEMHGEISTAGGGGSHMSYVHGRRAHRPPQLIIDNPNDAASTVASDRYGGVRFDMSAIGGLPTVHDGATAVAAVANDRNVIDAEDQWHADRTSAMQGPGSEVYAVSASGVPGSRISAPQREPSRADQSGIDEPHTISPFKWWVDRGVTQPDANMWLDKPDNTIHHADFWYDTEAILSRKSSVRFRRTVDLMLPVYNEEGEYAGNAKQAVEVHKYCVLVLDVPVDEALAAAKVKEYARRQQRTARSATAASSRAPSQINSSTNGSSSVSQSKLTHSNVSMHVGSHAESENANTVWNWVGRYVTLPLNIIPGLRQPTPSSLHEEHSTHHNSAAGHSHAPGTPLSAAEDRTPLQPNRSNSHHQQRRRRQALPTAESVMKRDHADCLAEYSDDEIATLLEGGLAPDDAEHSRYVAHLGKHRSAAGMRHRRAGATTDLRQHAAAERLGASLRNTEHAAPSVIEGSTGQEVWRNIMAKASIPKELHQQLCQWVDSEGLLQKKGMFSGEVSRNSGAGKGARTRMFSAGAVAESRNQGGTSDHMDMGPSRDDASGATHSAAVHPSQSINRRNGHDNGIDDPNKPEVLPVKMEVLEDAEIEGDRVGQIAVDAAVAKLSREEQEMQQNHDALDPADDDDGGNPVRDEVSKKVAVAFDSIFTKANPRLIPVLNHQRVHLQLLKWDKLQQKLEAVEEAESRLTQAAEKGGKPFVPVTHRVGFLGIFGKEVPSAEHYKQCIRECEEDIDFERQFVFKHGYARSYFVVFETQTAAAVAAQALLHSGDARWYKTKQAPGPDDVNWSALWCSSDERLGRRMLAGLLYFIIMCIPLGAFAGVLSVLSDLICDPANNSSNSSDELTQTAWEAEYDEGCLGSDLLERIITQVLPAVLVILWQNAIMPLTIYSIALFEKSHVALSALDRRILMLFFYWDMFNVFLGAILAGSISEEVKNLINNPGSIGSTLGTSLPKSSNFFINYLALRAFGLVPFRLILVHGGIWRWLFKCGGKGGCVVTARDAAAFMAPASIRYGRELGVMMLVFITGWAYAVVSPLVVVVSAIYFMSSWIVWRWQVVYVYVRCYEGGGSLWRSIVACIMLCLYTFVFFTSCVFVAKSAFYQAAFVLPLSVVISAFWRYLRLKYHPALKHVALEVSVKGQQIKINDMSYISAPLRPKCSGWHPEWGKAWESWGAPSYVA